MLIKILIALAVLVVVFIIIVAMRPATSWSAASSSGAWRT